MITIVDLFKYFMALLYIFIMFYHLYIHFANKYKKKYILN